MAKVENVDLPSVPAESVSWGGICGLTGDSYKEIVSLRESQVSVRNKFESEQCSVGMCILWRTRDNMISHFALMTRMRDWELTAHRDPSGLTLTVISFSASSGPYWLWRPEGVLATRQWRCCSGFQVDG